MKKILLSFVLIFLGIMSQAQNGLDSVIVEKYYISNAADAAGSSGILPVGSITYRIYVSMKTGYKFQMAYGNATHNLKMTTTTSFFNNEDYGSTTPNFSKANAAKNTVMLDSWLSVGAACNGNFGVMKSEDNGTANVVNTNGLLANNAPAMGIPLTTQDGFLAGSPQSVTMVGITTEADVFGDGTANGNSFILNNAAWSSLNGSTGPTSTNRVLIAQITTDGIFHYELNVQLGTPQGGVQNYVSSNPVMYNGQMELTMPSLSGTLNLPIWNGTVSTDWNNPANWSNNMVPVAGSNIEILATAPNQPHVNNLPTSPAVCNSIVVDNGAVLTIDAGKALTVNGTITLNSAQSLVVKSDASGTGSLLDNGIIGSGTASIERYLTPNVFHQLSLPISNTISAGTSAGQTGNVFLNCTLDSYNESTDNYVGMTSSNNVTPDKGYVTKYVNSGVGAKTIQFVGNPNTGAKSFVMTKNLNGYNLIPNPYASSIDWNATGWVKNVAADNTIYVWNETSAQYATYDGAIGVSGGSNYIAPGQSFFVTAQAAGNIQMTNSVRAHHATSYLKSTNSISNSIRLKVTGSATSYSDESVIYLNNNSVSQGSEKWITSQATAPSLYSVKNAKNYAINILPLTSINQAIPVAFTAGVNGNYTITATEIGTFSNVASIILTDLQTGNTQDLLVNPSYSFTSATTDNANRFVLNLSTTASVKEINKASLKIFAADRTIKVYGKSMKVEVYTALGQRVRSIDTNSDSFSIDMNNEAIGTYVVKVIANDKVYTQKVIIK